VLTGACPASSGSLLSVVYLQDTATPLPSSLDDANSTTASNYPYRAGCSTSGTFSLNLANTTEYWDTATQALVSTAIPDGTYIWSLVAFTSSDSGATWIESAGVFYQLIVDTTVPVAPTLTIPAVVAAGQTAAFTAPGPLAFSGACTAGDTVTLHRASGSLTAVCDSTGTYLFTNVDEGANATYSYTFTQTTLTGMSSVNTTLNWTRISGISSPVITSPSVNPYLSNQNTLGLSGTCTAGLTVNLAGAATQSAACSSSGTFLFIVDETTGAQVDRTFNFTITQTTDGTPANTSASVAFSWHQDTTPPDITVSYALPLDPALASSSVSPLTSPAAQSVFEFGTSDATAMIECNLNNLGWAACTSPTVYTSAQIAATPTVNSIAIRARDPAGNVSTTPYQRYWVRQSFATAALYHLDTSPGATVDSSPYNAITDSTLTAVNAPTSVTGQFSQAENFASASSQYMWVGDRPHHATRTNMTVEMFVEFNSAPANGTETILASKWDTASQFAWEFGVAGVNVTKGHTVKLQARAFFRTYTLTSSGMAVVTVQEGSTHTVSTTKFEHYAATWSRGTVSLYYKGTLKAQVTPGVAGVSLIPDGTGNLYLGTTENGSGSLTKFLNGRIDEARVSQAVCYTGSTFTVPTAAFTTADCAAP